MAIAETDNWIYSPNIAVGNGFSHHTGPMICVNIRRLLESYHGQVQMAKFNGSPHPEYVDAKSTLLILGYEIQPGDILSFRFEHAGKKTTEAINHLEKLLSLEGKQYVWLIWIGP